MCVQRTVTRKGPRVTNHSRFQAVFETLCQTGIPGVRISWARGRQDMVPPFFCFRVDDAGIMHADNRAHAALPRYRADLYLNDYDGELVDTFTQAVACLGPYTCAESWDEDEQMPVITYRFTVNEV